MKSKSEELIEKFNHAMDGRDYSDRHVIASRVLYRTQGMLAHRLNTGTAAQRRFAEEVFAFMVESAVEV